jgi:predicted transcriptional regulator of viral defense system
MPSRGGWSSSLLVGTEQAWNDRTVSKPYFYPNYPVKAGQSSIWSPLQVYKINPGKLIGIIDAGYGNHSFRITDIEKTFVDCFDLPQYSGGCEELIRAFNKAKLNGEKLINYSSEIGNNAVIKRMGFLAELLEKPGLKRFFRES